VVVNNGDGTFTYTPVAGVLGVVTFDYQACEDGGACGTATVTINISDTNQAPVAVDDIES
ncbi:MAG: endonuclease I, partial [Bacteroidetes bacterium]|nr:endonuclease I [Bacteroidota bacterium]